MIDPGVRVGRMYSKLPATMGIYRVAVALIAEDRCYKVRHEQMKCV